MTDTLHVQGVPRDASEDAAVAAAREVFLQATNDCAWLQPGDRVLVKPALNSPQPYPCTTSPASLRAVVQALGERGADVVVGDLPGLEHVVLDPEGSHKLSARDCFERSGMGADLDVPFVGFEERGWEDGFFHYQDERAASWPDGFHITRAVREVDHVVSLPRLSTHAQAGFTLGAKSAVGYLRSDSRMQFHRDGPFYGSIKAYVKDADLPHDFPNGHHFYEKIVEIRLALEGKLRATLIDGRQAQVTFGPDQTVTAVRFHTKQVTPSTGLIFASANATAVEVLGVAALTVAYRELAGCWDKFLQKLLMLINTQARELGSFSPWAHPFVSHALALGLDSPDFEARYEGVPDPLRERLDRLIARPEG